MGKSRYKLDDSPFAIQVRVIVALVLRETRVTFGTAQLGYFWAIVNPVLSTAVLVAVFSFVSRVPPIGTGFTLFFATGIIPFEMYKKLSYSMMNVFKQNKGLMAYPLVKEIDAVFARFLLLLATYMLIMILFFGGLIALGLAPPPADIGGLLGAIGMLSLFGLGMGLVNAIVQCLWGTWAQVEGILSRPLFFISGIIFIPTTFPPNVSEWLLLNPIMHLIDWFRSAYYLSYDAPMLDKTYVFYWTIILLFLGFAGERLFRKQLSGAQ